jgi:hypothetical protein
MRRARWALLALVVASLLVIPASRVVRSLRMTGGGVATFTSLLAFSNAGDLYAVRSLCSRRYLESHRIARSTEGGVVGLPRGIHKNFQAWVEGDEVWLCPTNRVGPVYRFVLEGGTWKFDGLVGLLRPGGRVEPLSEEPASSTGREHQPHRTAPDPGDWLRRTQVGARLGGISLQAILACLFMQDGCRWPFPVDRQRVE